jgi:hypothetical protein
MSTVKSKKLQVGADATSSNNFTIYQPSSPDGTLRIGVGNADSPTEVARFDATGMISGYPDTTPDALSTATGSAPSYRARAWVNFNGQGTVAIRSSGNVSSITDRGTGRYSVNFSTAMPDNGYSTVASASKWDNNDDANVDLTIGTNNLIQTSSTAYLTVGAGTNTTTQDPNVACVAIFR